VGWLAARDSALIERAVAIKDYTTICHSAPSEILAIIALRARDAIIGRNRAIVRNNLSAMRAFAAAHTDAIEWIEPRGSSVAFPLWKGAEPVEAFCRRAIEDYGVLIVPGGLFDYPGGHFRVGMGRRNFEEALRAAASALPTARSTPAGSRSTPPPSSR
jgi:aspartate/methionine/tyrosine aminotransferase